tara:strand:- start:1176 stop:1448 length:273 start_codon:yes stop_codon:yes gene_type:complete
MIKRNQIKNSGRFLPPKSILNSFSKYGTTHKEIYPDGHWTSLRVNLELRGWTPSQIKMIRDYLKSGWSLKNAMNYVSLKSGSCPLNQGEF